MTKTICDKCGREFHEYGWQALTFPSYIITVIEDMSSQARKVDLCDGCRQKFDDWLHNKEGTTSKE